MNAESCLLEFDDLEATNYNDLLEAIAELMDLAAVEELSGTNNFI